jgi:hypothetical protein
MGFKARVGSEDFRKKRNWQQGRVQSTNSLANQAIKHNWGEEVLNG